MATERSERIRKIKPRLDTFYKVVDGVRLPVKLYINEGSDIGVLTIHGGAWKAIDCDSETWNGSWMNYQAQYYYDKGFTTAAISYRDIALGDDTTVFDQIEDCKDAISFFKEKADFKKLIIMGDSAGGHLCCMLGLENLADIVVAANPAVDLTDTRWEFTAKTHNARVLASPIFNVRKTDAKFFVIHGNKDTIIDINTTKEFSEKMCRAGNDCKFCEVDGARHAFIISCYELPDERVEQHMAIIDKYLEENI